MRLLLDTDALVSGNFVMPVSQLWFAVTLRWAASWCAEPDHETQSKNRTQHVRTAPVESALNITLSIDERVAERARKAAGAMGKSLNQAARAYLEQLAGAPQLAAELQAFEKSALSTSGRLLGWKLGREEANRRTYPA